ncbi:MAG TPA: ATP-binding cassette domain-containing protein, partial [Polyangiaceae bacterium]|nr:ATP-binding cassette domain-containing protein [Polyangiaceae bacterium]
MLEARDLHLYYGSSHALRGASVELAGGTCTCIMGRNGVGKTTLLRAIMGLLPLRSGSVRFEGAELAGKDPSARAAAGIGYVPQGREIFADLTVEENLEVGVLGKRGAGVPDLVFRLF